MDKDIDLVVSEYLKLIKEQFSDIESAYVFGSYAKGKSNLDSDIDLAPVFKNLEDSKRFDRQVQSMLTAAKIDSGIEPHPLSSDDFNSANPFVAEIKKTGTRIAA